MGRYHISRVLLSLESTSLSPTLPEYSEVVIIFTCLLCALICAVGVLGVIRWTCLKRPTVSGNTDVEADARNEVLKKKIVESLPRLIFKSAVVTTADGETTLDVVPSQAAVTTSSSSEAECVICLSEFVDGEEIRVLPGCCHVFHVGCIDKWLIGSNSFCCPSCRRVLVVKQCHKCKIDASVSLPSTQITVNDLTEQISETSTNVSRRHHQFSYS